MKKKILIIVFTVLGIIGMILFKFVSPESAASQFAFLEPLIYIIFISGIWLTNKYGKIRNISPKLAIFIFILISWLTGMIIEATLSEGGLGGFHQETIPSFILAQGFYLPFAIIGIFLIRKYHYTFGESFFLIGGAVSIYEMIFFVGIFQLLLSPFFFLVPIVIAYYIMIYASILCMSLAFIDVSLLWKKQKYKEISRKRKLLYALLAGLIIWAIQGIYAELMTYLLGFAKLVI